MERLDNIGQAIAGLHGMHALFEYVNDMATHGCMDAIKIRIEICNTIGNTGAAVEHTQSIREMAHGIINAPAMCMSIANSMAQYFGTFGLDVTMCSACAWYLFDRCKRNDMHAQRLVQELGNTFV